MWRNTAKALAAVRLHSTASSVPSLFQRQEIVPAVTAPARLSVRRWFSAPLPTQTKEDGKVVEDDAEDLGIATGLELQELLAEWKGKKLFDLEPPRGPFGTKEAPAIIQSNYDERIVGCSGGFGEDEHDVLWFRLKKGQPHECRLCTQVFQLEVVGPGGLPGGHHHTHH